MKRSMAAAFTAVILMISLCSCGKADGHDNYKEIYKRYNDMESFYAKAQITINNGQTNSDFLVEQIYKAPKNFKMTVLEPKEAAGSGYIFKDGSVLIKSGFGHNETFEGEFIKQRNAASLWDFFEEYYKSEETFVTAGSGITGSETVMSCYIPGKNERRFMQSLWIDNKTYLPVKLITYDVDENPVICVSFLEFERNCEIDEENFN